jgi:uncharacterized protein YggE
VRSRERQFRYSNGENRFVGYKAKIEFNVVLSEMDKVDPLLSGLIAAEANELTSVTFQTTLPSPCGFGRIDGYQGLAAI